MATSTKIKFVAKGNTSATERPCRAGVASGMLPEATPTSGKTMSKGDYTDTKKNTAPTALRQSVSATNGAKNTNSGFEHLPPSDVYSETQALPNAYPSLQDTPQKDGTDSYVTRTNS